MSRLFSAPRRLTLLIKPAAGLCNMRCGYCFYRAASGTRENAVMTPETAGALLRRIREYRPDAVSVIFQGGEPTLAGLPFYRDFVARLQETVGGPVRCAMQTNGLLTDEGWAAFFRERRFLVGLSLDGDQPTNDRCRRDACGESVFDRVTQSADLLRRYRVPFNILSVIDDRSAGEIDANWRFFRDKGFRYLQFIPCLDEGTGVGLSAEGYEGFLKRSFDLWYRDLCHGEYVSVRQIDNYVGILLGRPPESCANSGRCGGYWVVEANGDLYPCDFYCRETWRVGSVFTENAFDNTQALRAFTEPSLSIHEHCRGCRYYLLCRGGCRRDRTEDGTRNRYCAAYSAFFDYAADRLVRAAEMLGGTDAPFAGQNPNGGL